MWLAVVLLATALSAGVQSQKLQDLQQLAEPKNQQQIEDVQIRVLQLLQHFDIRTLLDDERALNDTQCGRDLNTYSNGIKALNGWALTMFDSNAKIPEGLLKGNMYFMGQFDECVGVKNEAIEFRGKHCLPKLSIGLPRENPGSSGWLSLVYHYGLCVPSSCPASQLEAALNFTLVFLGEAVGLDLRVDMPEEFCRTDDYLPLDPGDYVVIGFLVVMVLIVVASTTYDVNQRIYRNNNKPHPILSAFSAYTNLKTLLTISNEGQMACLNGLRTLSMMWVVMFHCILVIRNQPTVNLLDAAEYVKGMKAIPFTAGFFSVDTFFFLSGFLACFVFFRDIGRKGTFDVPLAYIHRYLRLTPPYAVMILLQVTILNKIGDGPLWYPTNQQRLESCKADWWSGLLYVQNYVEPETSCLGQSWYLSADMQMYWVGHLLLYPLLLWPKVGAWLLGLVTAAVTSLVFALAYVNDLGPSAGLSHHLSAQKAIDYTPFYTRMAPWLVGAGMSMLINRLKENKVQVKLSKFVVLLGWIFSTGTALSIMYTFYIFFNDGYNVLQSAFHLSFSRLGWGLAIGWIVFACLHGYGGPVNTFLSWNIFQPLGKLSYSVFLVHISIQFYRTGILRTNTFFNEVPIVYNFIGDWILANLLALPFFLMFEMPILIIERHLFRNVSIYSYPRKPKKIVAVERKPDAEIGKNAND